MSSLFFRPEVFASNRDRWLGSVSVVQPVKLWVMTAFAITAAVAVVLFVCLGTYTHRSTVTGQLFPIHGLAAVTAPATGVVTDVIQPEGARVGAQARLAILVVPRATPRDGDTLVALKRRLAQRQTALESAAQAQHTQLNAQAQGLHVQLTNAKQECAHLNQEVQTRQSQVKLARTLLSRLRTLLASQYVSQREIEQQQATVLEYTEQVQELQRQVLLTQRTIAQLEQTLSELPQQHATLEATLQRELAQVAQERVQTEMQGVLAINAPISGIIATPRIKPGQTVQAGETVMSLLPRDGMLEADVWVPSRAIGFITPGDPVQLRYQAYPYQKFGHQQGRVKKISRSSIDPRELAGLSGYAPSAESFYRVTIALAKQQVKAYGKLESLKPGMVLEADIFGEKRRLIEWLFDPLYALTGH